MANANARLPDRLPNLERDELVDSLVPGKRIWLKVLDPDEKNGVTMYGTQGEIVFAGYQVIGNTTFLVLDRAEGAGKKSKVTSFSVNAMYVVLAGPVSLGEND